MSEPTPPTRGLRDSLYPHAASWRHPKWCRWERGQDDPACDCGLDDLRRALVAATPPTSEPFDISDGMCPNCVTPWKCNGPHLYEQTVAGRRAATTPAPEEAERE